MTTHRTLRAAFAALALALSSAGITGPLAAQAGGPAPVVEKVDPPSWWVPSTVNPVRVMIRGKHLAGATLACGRLTCTNLRVNAAGTYVFADVRIPGTASPGKYPLTLRTAAGTADASFEITAPLPRRGRFQGFGSDDVFYLVMPDRFANGDPSNDDPARSPGMHERHYSPATPVRLDDQLSSEDAGLTFEEPQNSRQIQVSRDPAIYAAMLYFSLADLDRRGVAEIVIERPPQTPEWLAVWDRLRRCSS